MSPLEWPVISHLKASQNWGLQTTSAERAPACSRRLAVANGKCRRLWRNFSWMVLKSLRDLQVMYTESAKPFGHRRVMHFPGLLGKLSPHRRHLSDLSSRAEVKGDWKWITSLVRWFITTFPWHQVLSYTLTLLFLYLTFWLMLENSPTRKEIKWFPEREKEAVEVSNWACQMPRKITWDVPVQNSTTIAQECVMIFGFPAQCIHDVTCFYLLELIYLHCFIVDQLLFLP